MYCLREPCFFVLETLLWSLMEQVLRREKISKRKVNQEFRYLVFKPEGRDFIAGMLKRCSHRPN